MTGRYYQPLPSAPSTLESEPPCAAPADFEISVAGRQVPLVVDFGDVGRAKVYFDPKGAGDLRAVKPLSAPNSMESRGAPQGYGQYEIGPLVMDPGSSAGKNGAPFKLLVTKSPSGNPQGHVRVVPVEQFSGSATLGGRKVDVVLVDADFDGKLRAGFRAEDLPGRSNGPPPPFDASPSIGTATTNSTTAARFSRSFRSWGSAGGTTSWLLRRTVPPSASGRSSRNWGHWKKPRPT
ncbi:MAG: hypothetical protein WC076_06260 [Terrimicrobiaceae bacterium]|nr:hypothetical protein [Terrimicrobiaceae bacterium]